MKRLYRSYYSTLLTGSAFFLVLFIFRQLSAQDSVSFVDKHELDSELKGLNNFVVKGFDVYEFKKISITKDSILKNKDTVINFVMKKQPWRAVVYSAILPGLGQFYNESYWKVPLIAGFAGYFTYVMINNNNKFIDYKELYANSITPENPNGVTTYKDLREFYRNQRDQFFLYFAFLYLIQLADAYVDSHMYDFDVAEKIRIGLFKNNKLIDLNLNF